jgi:hypothetical protein
VGKQVGGTRRLRFQHGEKQWSLNPNDVQSYRFSNQGSLQLQFKKPIHEAHFLTLNAEFMLTVDGRQGEVIIPVGDLNTAKKRSKK